MDSISQTDRLISVLCIFHKYNHTLECRDGYVEICPSNWRKVNTADKKELRVLGFKWNKDQKFGDFRLDHFQVSTPTGPIFR
jgi:hypothetical protein